MREPLRAIFVLYVLAMVIVFLLPVPPRLNWAAGQFDRVAHFAGLWGSRCSINSTGARLSGGRSWSRSCLRELLNSCSGLCRTGAGNGRTSSRAWWGPGQEPPSRIWSGPGRVARQIPRREPSRWQTGRCCRDDARARAGEALAILTPASLYSGSG
jgi:hypothetical protein